MVQLKRGTRVSYFGPQNTNTHLAAKKVFDGEVCLVPQLTKTSVFEAVESGDCEFGLVPIENSTEGVVRETIDCLITMSPAIDGEFEMDITHCLLSKAGSEKCLPTKIISHPQPLAQCRKWLDKNYPKVPRLSSVSTASAAEQAARDPGTFAIATGLAARSHRLSIIAENIADCPDNATRFVRISLKVPRPTGNDKTSLVFTTPHQRGALNKVLSLFDDANVNMTRIESRPLAGQRWEYAFVVDVEGHQDEPPLHSVLIKLKSSGCLKKLLGSYPRSVASLDDEFMK